MDLEKKKNFSKMISGRLSSNYNYKDRVFAKKKEFFHGWENAVGEVSAKLEQSIQRVQTTIDLVSLAIFIRKIFSLQIFLNAKERKTPNGIEKN